jgi:hypothetical protein
VTPLQHITGTFSSGFYSGGGAASDVPWKWPIAIAGRPYMIDTKMSDAWGHKGIPLLRQQQDNQTTPSGVSLSSEGVWRAGVDSWHKGAGQSYRDRPDSNPFRFRSSKGVDPWTRYQLSLLPATDQKKTSVETNLALQVAGSRLYVVDGQTVSHTSDVTVGSPTWTAVTGVPAAAILSICSDGYYVWFTDGVDIYRTNTGTSAAGAAWSTDNATMVRFAKGRLFGVVGNVINTYSDAAVATPLVTGWTVPNAFTWVDICGGPSTPCVYAAGFVGDKSLIFKYNLKDDGTGLDAGVVALELPDGEIVRSISAYLNTLLIGTDNGVRFAVVNQSSGDLTAGATLDTDGAVQCFEGQGPHVWFGWKNYDATSTGLGRLSLEEFSSTDNLAPAYASDLMVTAQGAVLSVVTFQGRRVFTVSGSGVWGEETTLVTSGTVESGRITANISEPKTSLAVDVRHRSFAGGTDTVAMSVDGGSFTTLGGALSQDGSVPAVASGSEFEFRHTLAASGGVAPVLSSWTFRFVPSVKRQTIFTVPVLLHDVVDSGAGPEPVDILTERQVMEGYYKTGAVVVYQSAQGVRSVVVDDFEWRPIHFKEFPSAQAEGTLVLTLKEVGD